MTRLQFKAAVSLVKISVDGCNLQFVFTLYDCAWNLDVVNLSKFNLTDNLKTSQEREMVAQESF